VSNLKESFELYQKILQAYLQGGLSKSEICERFNISQSTLNHMWNEGIPYLELPPLKDKIIEILQKESEEETEELLKALKAAKKGIASWTQAISEKANAVAKEVKENSQVIPTSIVGTELDRSVRLIKFLQGEAEQKVEVDMGMPSPEQLAKIIKCLPEDYREQLLKLLKNTGENSEKS
jgi:transposase-like protein